MSTTIYRTEDPALETVEFGAVYRIRAPHTVETWTLYKVSDDCGVDTIDVFDIPDGWDDSYEYATADTHTWVRLGRLAVDAYFAYATLEVAFVPVDDALGEYSYAMLNRFVQPY